jgi:hypothetical protein
MILNSLGQILLLRYVTKRKRFEPIMDIKNYTFLEKIEGRSYPTAEA